MHLHQNRPASSGQWLRRHDLLNFITTLYEGDLHAKRVLSLANATLGVLTSASLAIHAVGRGLAQAMGTLTKHGVKQVDRLLSNRGLNVWAFFAYWTPFIVGARTEVVVALDWTSFAADGQDTIVLSMVTGHGRATPLLWKTVGSSTLKGNQQVSGSSPLAGSNKINNLQSLAGSAIAAVSALCRQIPRIGPQEPAPRGNIVNGCDGRPVGPPWPRAVNNSSSIAVRCRRAAAVAGKVSGLRGRCARPSRHRGSGSARPIAVQLAADPRSEAMTFGLIVARIPDAGLADAPDDALDAALGLPRRAVGAPAPSIASMARWMATSWLLSERSSLRSASRIPLLDIVTCSLRGELPPHRAGRRNARASTAGRCRGRRGCYRPSAPDSVAAAPACSR